ncbi:MAG: helix-turn-helix domain-containing protein [Ignavibacteriae bacterium]|nr:helix-turn-helix domain-containing protein [Ignavibacteriota bacterium]NOG96749.1 helix-turn-helix domain-containing protein [Ignavibacteriota bacterium]
MEKLKYTVIKNKIQYDEYCNIIEELVSKGDERFSDEIDLLTILVEKWDHDHNSFEDVDPIELLKSLMENNNLKAKDLVEILELSKGTISKIMNYQKGLSKETIRKLSNHFNISQEAFNRPYKLVSEVNKHFRDASLMNTRKKLKKEFV